MKTKLLLILILLASCTKDKTDYSYWNTDRRPQVIRISERYKNPMEWLNGTTWKPYKIVYDSMDRDIDYRSYEGLKPDTSPVSTCKLTSSTTRRRP